MGKADRTPGERPPPRVSSDRGITVSTSPGPQWAEATAQGPLMVLAFEGRRKTEEVWALG